MKNISIIIVALLFSGCFVGKKVSDKEKRVFSPKPVYTAYDNSIFWKVSGNGITKPSYILGTMHSICKDKYIWTAAMNEAFNSADALVLEMDLSDMTAQFQMAKDMMLNGDTTLANFLSEEQYNKVNHFIEEKNIPNAVIFDKMRPAFSSATMAMQLFTCDDQESYEMNLMAKAKKDEKPIVGLETMQEQMKALNSLGDSASALSLYELTANYDSAVASMNTMMDLFNQQKIDTLSKLINDDKTLGSAADDLLNNRNKNWVVTLQKLLPTDSYFIAVGAGHLGGKEGLLNLLREKGYTITPIK